MSKKTTTTVWATSMCILVLAGQVNAQEVASDVKIPPPREMVTGTLAVGGINTGPTSTFGVAGLGQVFQGAASQAASGVLSEDETRDRLGHFMTSLLVREGIITFAATPTGAPPTGAPTTGAPTATPTASLGKREDGSSPASRPAWAGSTPMVISVTRARRPE